MTDDNRPTTAQLRDDIASGRTASKVSAPHPAAAPLGTDDEAAGTPAEASRIEMARQAEQKIGEAARRQRGQQDASDEALEQRPSSAPYAKEDHMNAELLKRSASGEDDRE